MSSGSKALALLLVLAALPPAAVAQTSFGEQMAFGVEMARKGLWREALFRFQQASRMEPGNVRALNNLAVAYEAVGLFDEALATYREALKVSPNDSELRGNYSQFLELYQSFESDGEGEEAGAAQEEDEEQQEDGAAAPEEGR